MPNAPHTLISCLRTMVIGAWRNDPRDDAELLAKYAESRDEMAFAALMWRHGTLVWRTCRQLLGDTPDAEDAFQSTFLALSRQAGRLRREPLAGWLYRVARRASLDARAGSRRRQNLEQKLRAGAETKTEEEEDRTKLHAGLSEELDALPERLRLPLLLHYLEGKSQAEVARILGCARSTLQERMEKGEAILRKRLEKRGLTLGAVSVAALMGNITRAPAVPGRLIESTARAAVAFHSGVLTDASAKATENLLRSLSFKGAISKSWWLILACVSTFGLGSAGLMAWKMYIKSDGNTANVSSAPISTSVPPKAVHKRASRIDAYGDPLPEDAIARIGTTRLHQAVQHIAFLADGKSFVAAGNTIRVWDLTGGKEIRRLEGYPDGVEFCGFSSKSNLVAFRNKTGGEEKHDVHLWNVSTGKELSLKNPVRYANIVGACPNGKLVALPWSESGSFRFLDVETGAVRADGKLNRDDTPVNTFAWSPDNKTIALGKTRVVIWDLLAKHVSQTLRVSDGPVQQLAYSRDGSVLVAKCQGDKVYVWDAVTGKEYCQYKARSDEPFAISPDGKRLLTRETWPSQMFVLHDLETGKKLQLDPGGWWITQFCEAAFSPDGKTLVIGGSSAIRCWDAITGREIIPAADFWEKIYDVAVSPDGRLLATADKGGGIRLWNPATGQLIRKLCDTTKPELSNFDHTLLTFTHDGRKVVALVCNWGPALKKRTVRLWDVADNRMTQEFHLRDGLPAWFTLCPDDKFLAVFNGSATGCMTVDLENGKETPLETVSGKVTAAVAAFAPNGRELVVGFHTFKGYALTILDRATGKSLRVQENIFNDPNQHCTSIAYSPDGRSFATTDSEGGVSLWESVTLKLFWKGTRLDKNWKRGGFSRFAAFASDGRTLVTTGEQEVTDGREKGRDRIHLWDVATGREIYCLTGNEDANVTGAAFIEDNRRLVSWSGEEGTALIWDLTGKLPTHRQYESPLSSEQLRVLWDDLYGSDAARAYRAVNRLTSVPQQALQLIKEYLCPAPQLDVDRVKRLLKDLDSDTFAVRQRAAKELSDLGESSASELRQALDGSPSTEVRHQVEELLRQCRANVDGFTLRQLRAVTVLEYINSNESRELLKALAKGEPRAQLTQEAKASLERLSHKEH